MSAKTVPMMVFLFSPSVTSSSMEVLDGPLHGLAHGFVADGNAAAFGEVEGVDDVEVFTEEGF